MENIKRLNKWTEWSYLTFFLYQRLQIVESHFWVILIHISKQFQYKS